MAERKKVLFVDGMSNDFLLIITDAPIDVICEYCEWHNEQMENGGHFECFAPIKELYYVNVILDSELDDKEDVEIIGYSFMFDFSKYKSKTENSKEIKYKKYRLVKFSAGMTNEFEIIITNAPDCVIEANLKYNSCLEEEGEAINNPYEVIEVMGYKAICIGSQNDFDFDDLKEMNIEAEFDYYDY